MKLLNTTYCLKKKKVLFLSYSKLGKLFPLCSKTVENSSINLKEVMKHILVRWKIKEPKPVKTYLFCYNYKEKKASYDSMCRISVITIPSFHLMLKNKNKALPLLYVWNCRMFMFLQNLYLMALLLCLYKSHQRYYDSKP